MHAKKPILIVEDTESDLQLLRYGFKSAGIDTPLVEMHNGVQAEEYLSGAGPFADRDRYPQPCLVITDLKMPMVDGLELLEWMNRRPELSHIPKIMLSSSGIDEDRAKALEHGACAFLVKPGGIGELIELTRHIDATWIRQHCQRG